MLDFSSLFRQLLKNKQLSYDNFAFKLQYRYTWMLLCICSLLVTCYQYWGQPISCRSNGVDVSQSIQYYCWIQSTFTFPDYVQGEPGINFVAPGVSAHRPDDQKKHHTYYQWVSIVLFIQAMFFYVPHFIWKSWEGSKLHYIVQNLHSPMLDESGKNKEIQFAAKSLERNLNRQNIYAFKFFFCEILNVCNLLVQISFVDAFLGGDFMTFGIEIFRFINLDQRYRTDPMVKLFPKLTKCTFFEFGPTGTIENIEALCILPLNNLNEKIFIILWFWFMMVVFFTVLHIIYRIITIVSPSFRMFWITHNVNSIECRKQIKNILNSSAIGDWFVLDLLKKNINAFYFEEIVAEVISLRDQRLNKERNCRRFFFEDLDQTMNCRNLEKNCSFVTSSLQNHNDINKYGEYEVKENLNDDYEQISGMRKLNNGIESAA